MRDRLTRLETVIGDDGAEGMRGDIKTIKETLGAMQARIYLAIGGGAVLLSLVQVAIQLYAVHK